MRCQLFALSLSITCKRARVFVFFQNNHLQRKRVSAHRFWHCNAIKLMMCLICTPNLRIRVANLAARNSNPCTKCSRGCVCVSAFSLLTFHTCNRCILYHFQGIEIRWIAAPTLICVKTDIGQWTVSSHLISSHRIKYCCVHICSITSVRYTSCCAMKYYMTCRTPFH